MLKKSSVAVIGVLLVVLASLSPAAAQQNLITYVVELNVIVPPGQAKNMGVPCNPGDLALSGGYRTGPDMIPSHFEPNAKKNAVGWRFILINPRNIAVNVAIEVLCLHTEM